MFNFFPSALLYIATDESIMTNADQNDEGSLEDLEKISVQEAAELDTESLDLGYDLTVALYQDEWDKLCEEDIELSLLRFKALQGGLRTSRFRGLSWMLMLGALTPGSSELWLSEAHQARSHYSKLKSQVTSSSPSLNAEPTLDNPLSQDEHSTWNQYFCDKELRSVIHQDVIRTFPGVDFFRNTTIQDIMVDILFCYARENPTMCYRQGMHEVLAPLLFVLHCDHQALLHIQELGFVSEQIQELLNPDFIEEDSYTLFRRIMNAIEGSYLIPDVAPTSSGYFPPRPKCKHPPAENQAVTQLNWIKERILCPNDPQLHQHLEKLDIPLPIFGIRWLRLMFGREFPLQDLLVLWDAIFADNSSFDLMNYIVVAMLIAVRDSLLSSDYTGCLTLLMRYPGSMDISFIIEYALHLKEPHKHSAPLMKAFPQVPMGVGRRNNTPFFVKKTSKKNKQSSSRMVLTAAVETEGGVVDGFDPNDPKFLMDQLRNAYALMSLCKLKLEHYHKVLESSISPHQTAAQGALTGIQELCSLLEPRFSNAQIDPAYEAGENGRSPELAAPSKPPRSSATLAPPQTPRRKASVDMTVFKHTVTPIPKSS